MLDGPLTQSGTLSIPENVENFIINSDSSDSDAQTGSLSFSGGTDIVVESGTWDGILLAPISINPDSQFAATDEEV